MNSPWMNGVFQDMETHFVTAELNLDVDFGEGAITNIFGWRNYENRFYSDIDAQVGVAVSTSPPGWNPGNGAMNCAITGCSPAVPT